jgi:hypothetical protein
MEKHRGFSICHFSFAIQDTFFSILLGELTLVGTRDPGLGIRNLFKEGAALAAPCGYSGDKGSPESTRHGNLF